MPRGSIPSCIILGGDAPGEEVIISNGKTPVVRLVALESKLGKRKPGAWKGRIQIGPEFFEPLPSDELEPWG